jgi:hypothetical protein
MNNKIKAITSSIVIVLAFLSCSIERMIIVPYNDGIMNEYQYRQGDKELVITFQRNSRTKCISSIVIKSNRCFLLANHKGSHSYIEEQKDNNFIVNVDSLHILLGDRLLAFAEWEAYNKDFQRISVKKHEIIITINADVIDGETEILQIIPSDFIMDNNKRVICDTLSIKAWQLM